MIYIFCDGASRGNPGPASIGVFACKEKEPKTPVFELSEKIGKTTNNVAEWTALIRGLEKAIELGENQVQVFMDSELVVRQVEGVYKVKHSGLIPLFQSFLKLKLKISSFSISHIPREKNKEADRLANLALDS